MLQENTFSPLSSAERLVEINHFRWPGTRNSIKMLNELEWASLQQRKKIFRLTNMYNIVNG